MTQETDTCLSGYGVVCGAEVHVAPDCSIEVDEGTLIFTGGALYHSPKQHFRYYVKPANMNAQVKAYMIAYLQLKETADDTLEFWQLADDTADQQTIDSLKQQHPGDVPKHNLMWNNVLVVLAFKDDEKQTTAYYWVLVSRNALAEAFKIGGASPADGQGLFTRPLTRKEVDVVTVDEFLRPLLRLPVLFVPRFGYKGLAYLDIPKGLKDDNIRNPFLPVTTYAQIFFEYKAIIDDYLLVFRDALKNLHRAFGPVLSHKGKDYLERYRKFLLLKVKMFYEEGEHLYYIQYIYDWLRDLTTAYNELVSKLNGFRSGCPCKNDAVDPEGPAGEILLLGPVMGSRSTYQPLIFRDLASAADTDRTIRDVRCLHWRLLMMIRTFDLPFLHLNKVVESPSDDQGIEEQLDSTDYWEYFNSQDNTAGDNKLPIKFTPTRGSLSPLGKRAIPYYYPIDSNSIYSVHQFWDYETTVLRRIDTHLSYNAYPGDPSKASTDTVNDCYTTRLEVIWPLAFDIEPYPFLRPEGHIGKILTPNDVDHTFIFNTYGLFEYLEKYNLCVDVIAIGLPGGETLLGLENFCGLEHRPALPQGHTLVLFFVNAVERDEPPSDGFHNAGEQIELQECKKDTTPEIPPLCVVADFVLPYRFMCCTAPAGAPAVYTLAKTPPPAPVNP